MAISILCYFVVFLYSCGNDRPTGASTSSSVSFKVSPDRGNPETVFTFTISTSDESEDNLSFRWDWESDGEWDTDFSTEKTVTHSYDLLGYKKISLEIKSDLGTKIMQRELLVTVASDEMVGIPAGEFLMGSPEGFEADDEHPQHTVYLDEFFIRKYEVTNEQYAEFLTESGKDADEQGNSLVNFLIASIRREGKAYKAKKGWEDVPIVGVSWYGAKACAEWYDGRLPTEAEWEKSARGTDGCIWPWGDFWASDYCNSWDIEPHHLRPVGSFPKGVSVYGLHDMAGNAFEWVNDWYQEDYYKVSPKQNPQGPELGGFKIMRGGGWPELSGELRTAFRFGGPPDTTDSRTGFRIVKDSE